MAKNRSSSKSNKQALRLRNAILGFVALLVIVVGGYGLLYSSGVNGGNLAEGEQYTVLEDVPARRPGAPIVVTEYFSWACVHCRNFDPLLEDWQRTLPEGVIFKRSPVSFSPMFALLAQTYIALEQEGALAQNHDRFFRAIHDNRKQFLSVEQIADFVDGNGISKDAFLTAYNSTSVRRRLAEIESNSRKAEIRSVPNLVVADKYRINMDVGRKPALLVADQLIALEQESAQ
ncbi:MAG: thiol:disulfide interchange protein DsbA/DsbL [Pseudomonadales bacterium]